MKKVVALFLTCIMLLCNACTNIDKPSEPSKPSEEKTTVITIPESLLKFSGSDAESTAKSYNEEGLNAKVNGSDVILEVTDKQREELIDGNNEYVQEILEEFEQACSDYECELSSDYKKVVFKYDEKIGRELQLRLLLGVTSMQVLSSIYENNDSDWSIEVIVENCHTGKIVGEAVVPGGEFFIGEAEWEESYNE